jgi:hypothetical protein
MHSRTDEDYECLPRGTAEDTYRRLHALHDRQWYEYYWILQKSSLEYWNDFKTNVADRRFQLEESWFRCLHYGYSQYFRERIRSGSSPYRKRLALSEQDSEHEKVQLGKRHIWWWKHFPMCTNLHTVKLWFRQTPILKSQSLHSSAAL